MKVFKANKEAIKASVKDEITQSEIMMRAACPRKWYYKYVLKLDRKAGPNYNFVYGELMHQCLALLYSSGKYNLTHEEFPIELPKVVLDDSVMILTPEDIEEIQLIREKVNVTFQTYRHHYHKEDSKMRVIGVEKVYETTWRGTKLTGRIDLAAFPRGIRDGLYIWDWKTAGRFDRTMLEAWSFRFQFLFYAWLYWRCTGHRPSGIMVNGIGKTLLRPLRQGKPNNESRKSYLRRVEEDMLYHPEKYFYRQRMPLIAGMLQRFEKEMLGPHLAAFDLLGKCVNVEVLAMAMNTNMCHLYGHFCEYLPLCKDGPLMLAEYNKREVKHREISDTEEIGEL